MLVSSVAPDFTAPAILKDNSINENFCFSEYVFGCISVLFFYPLDFTFVCPSEIIALNAKKAEFEQRGVKVVLVSVDSHFSHLAYKNTAIKDGGIGNISFPMVSDLDKKISESYDVLINDSVSLRATFILDKNMVIRHQSINDLFIGRNTAEILRVIDAIDFHEKNGDVCPADWDKGKKGMSATPEGVISYLKEHYS